MVKSTSLMQMTYWLSVYSTNSITSRANCLLTICHHSNATASKRS
ncbi:Uncharacterised protein [Vibrio cholerae]|nr:Uncharacterised protein [Vibrio cholerae]CSD03979.1 Uncharacterised protein [Vibrio cholerae]CSI66922.1 Uncharacterised protein [Vibrio cholerae]